MSAAISESISPMNATRSATKASASASPAVTGNLALESLLQHLHSCLLCKQELIVALIRDGHDYWSAATLVETVNNMWDCLNARKTGIYENVYTNADEEKCEYCYAEVCTEDCPKTELVSEYRLCPQRDIDQFSRNDYSTPHNYEPILKRQNAFEHISTQGSFESTSAAETEWMIECDPDDYCEDEAASALGVWSLAMPDLSQCPIFYLLQRQNAFEIPPAIREEEWGKYI